MERKHFVPDNPYGTLTRNALKTIRYRVFVRTVQQVVAWNNTHTFMPIVRNTTSVLENRKEPMDGAYVRH